jgi:hypothetical protein
LKQQDLINRLRDELTHIVTQTEGNSAMGLTDHNKIAENLICGLMREILDIRGLRNLNTTEHANYPAIDLADFGARIAVQVTATATLAKIKGTIGKFLKHGLQGSFDRLVVYVLARKQDSYSQQAIDKAAANARLSFDGNRDILDFRDLLARAVHLEPVRLAAALRVIEAYNRGVPAGLAEEDFDPPQDGSEEAKLNLVQFFFSQVLYIGDIPPEFLKRPAGPRLKNDRDVVRHYGRERGKTLPSDYYVYSNQLLTFHDLNDERNPFAWAVDAGTIVEIAPHEFYGADEAQERVFKGLLRYALQVKLYRERVLWRHEEKLFAFMPLQDEDLHRVIAWQDLKRSERHVYERKLSKSDEDKVFTQKHFAFGVDFYRLAEQWCVSLTPDWFFSYGSDFKSSRYASGSISWLKRRENNATIEQHFRFLVSWLRELDAEDMFSQAAKKPNVSIGDPVSVTGLPGLPDDEWLPVQAPELEGASGDLFADREEGA